MLDDCFLGVGVIKFEATGINFFHLLKGLLLHLLIYHLFTHYDFMNTKVKI